MKMYIFVVFFVLSLVFSVVKSYYFVGSYFLLILEYNE